MGVPLLSSLLPVYSSKVIDCQLILSLLDPIERGLRDGGVTVRERADPVTLDHEPKGRDKGLPKVPVVCLHGNHGEGWIRVVEGQGIRVEVPESEETEGRRVMCVG